MSRGNDFNDASPRTSLGNLCLAPIRPSALGPGLSATEYSRSLFLARRGEARRGAEARRRRFRRSRGQSVTGTRGRGGGGERKERGREAAEKGSALSLARLDVDGTRSLPVPLSLCRRALLSRGRHALDSATAATGRATDRGRKRKRASLLLRQPPFPLHMLPTYAASLCL